MRRLGKHGEGMKHRSTARFVAEGVEGFLVSAIVLLTWPLSKRWLRDWGSTLAERERVWPGDELVSPTHATFTRGVDVGASSEAVWSWLVQFGLGRGGFHSYELLERLVGIPVRNVESIVPEYQDLAVGDVILLHPKAPGIPVAALKQGRHVCFGMTGSEEGAGEGPDPARSWSMYIEPVSADSSRLLLRSCIEPLRAPTLAKRLGHLLEQPIDFIMEQRMLRTIRRLAESSQDRSGVRARLTG